MFKSILYDIKIFKIVNAGMALQKLVRISILTVSLLSPAGIGIPASDSDVTAAH